MDKNIYIIRHCEAEGQAADAPLTTKGAAQARELSDFLSTKMIDKVASSPFLRAVQTIQPFAEQHNLEIELDDRLRERLLSSYHLEDWMERLKATFVDMDLIYEGGESSNEALNRILEVVNDKVGEGFENIAIVAHGGIISLLLHHYDHAFGFEQWRQLSDPDVFLLTISNEHSKYQRIWREM